MRRRSDGHERFVGGFARRTSELDAEHGDVVVLPEGLGLLRDGGGRQVADGASALEAEELISRIHGFDDTIGEEGQAIAGLEREVAGREVDDLRCTEREGTFKVELRDR